MAWEARQSNFAYTAQGLQQYRGRLSPCRPLPRSEGGGGGDLLCGFGQLGEAVGQAGAGQDEGVGVGVFGLA